MFRVYNKNACCSIEGSLCVDTKLFLKYLFSENRLVFNNKFSATFLSSSLSRRIREKALVVLWTRQYFLEASFFLRLLTLDKLLSVFSFNVARPLLKKKAKAKPLFLVYIRKSYGPLALESRKKRVIKDVCLMFQGYLNKDLSKALMNQGQGPFKVS